MAESKNKKNSGYYTKKVNGKTKYYKDGKEITKAKYEKGTTTYSTKTVNGETKYYKKDASGKKTEVSKEDYNKATGRGTSYSSKTIDGKTHYYKTVDGKKTEISKTAYNAQKNGKAYKEGGKYYDKNGNKISQTKYKESTKTTYTNITSDPTIVDEFNGKLPTAYRDDQREVLIELAKQIKNNPDLTLQDAKEIMDNPEYLATRDKIAKSLEDGTYYDPNTDPMAQQYREDYTRAGQQAMNDTIANLAKRTGGLSSSYAGAMAQRAYNDYMDNMASKVNIDLRQLAEQSARQNANMYDTMNQTYRMGQQQNNDVIAQNNGYTTQEYNAALQKLQDAYNAYDNLSKVGYSRYRDEVDDFYRQWQMYLQDREIGNQERQFADDLAYRYAALAANQKPAAAAVAGGGGGGSYSGGGGGGSSDSDSTSVSGRGNFYDSTSIKNSGGTNGGVNSIKEGTLTKINETSGSGKNFADIIAPEYDERGYRINR